MTYLPSPGQMLLLGRPRIVWEAPINSGPTRVPNRSHCSLGRSQKEQLPRCGVCGRGTKEKEQLEKLDYGASQRRYSHLDVRALM